MAAKSQGPNRGAQQLAAAMFCRLMRYRRPLALAPPFAPGDFGTSPLAALRYILKVRSGTGSATLPRVAEITQRARAGESGGMSSLQCSWRHSFGEHAGSALNSNMTVRVLPHCFVHEVQRAIGVVRYADHVGIIF